MPSKNEIRSAEVAHLVRHAGEFGVMTGPVAIDMAAVRRRKRDMVDDQIAAHLQNYKASGAELIMGSGRFVAPKTLEVSLNDGGTRACWQATWSSLISGRTRQFRTLAASRLRSRSPMSKRWSSIICHHI